MAKILTPTTTGTKWQSTFLMTGTLILPALAGRSVKSWPVELTLENLRSDAFFGVLILNCVVIFSKATKGCDPGGMREPESDRPCDFELKSPNWEGYCECAEVGRWRTVF